MFTMRNIALGAATGLATLAISAVPPAQADPPTENMGEGGPATPLKNAAMIEKNKWGLRYKAGQQNSHLTVTFADGRLRYTDTGTQELREIPKVCERIKVNVGIAASCRLPKPWASGQKMFLEIHPRLGDDYVDASSLPAQFRLWALMDKGRDTVYAGAGDDYATGAQDADVVYTGGGNDWIRGGTGDDEVWGGDGNDKLVATYDNDEAHGGNGNDLVYGGPGNDALWGDSGTDRLICAQGNDTAHVDGGDHTSDCESASGY